MEWEVYEHILGEDDEMIAYGLTEEEATNLVAESPKTRTMNPSIINNS